MLAGKPALFLYEESQGILRFMLTIKRNIIILIIYGYSFRRKGVGYA